MSEDKRFSCGAFHPDGFFDDKGEYKNDPDNFYEEINDKLFNIEDNEGISLKTIRCIKCKTKHFSVAKGSWYTAIKCMNCGWEVCIHEG